MNHTSSKHYSIGQISKKTGIKIVTIRYYEKINLIAPPLRSANNYRSYNEDHLSKLRFIRHTRHLGFSIKEIKELLEISEHPHISDKNVHYLVKEHLSHIKEKIKSLEKIYHNLEDLIDQCHNPDNEACLIIENLREDKSTSLTSSKNDDDTLHNPDL